MDQGVSQTRERCRFVIAAELHRAAQSSALRSPAIEATGRTAFRTVPWLQWMRAAGYAAGVREQPN
jgi:hypothetical protein